MATTPKPNRLSPFYHKQKSLGAQFIQDQYGWSLPERFRDPNEEKNRTEQAVGLYDLSHLVKLSLKSDNISQAVLNLYKRNVKPGSLIVDGQGVLNNSLCAVTTSDEAVILTDSSSHNAVRELLNRNSGFQVVDVSSVIAGLLIVGKKSR
jgi:glycine cleavage system aminomethyltransferase T